MGTTHVGNLSGDTTRKPSGQLWQGCPNFAEFLNDPSLGWYQEDEFSQFVDVAVAAEAPYGKYHGFADTGGSVASAMAVDIGNTAVFSSDGDNEGASIEFPSKPFKISSSRGKFWAEVRLKTSTIADTKHGILFALIATQTLSATVPIAAAGTLADNDFVGFHRLEGDGDQWDTVYKAGGVTQVDVANNAKVIVADTYQKLGMYFDGLTTLSFWVDGIQLGDTKTIPDNTGTDFPADVGLGLCLAVLNATGSTPGNTTVDWWRAAQLR